MMIVVAAGLGLAATGQADPRPLKVFILAGQSNMEGHARISSSNSDHSLTTSC
jgi:hypothetical protein